MNQFNIFHIWLPENNFWMQTEIYYRKRRPMFSVMNEQEELIIQRGESDNSVFKIKSFEFAYLFEDHLGKTFKIAVLTF